MAQAYERIYFVQKHFDLATIDDYGDIEPKLLLNFSDKDAVFIKKGGRETVFGYRSNICRILAYWDSNGMTSASMEGFNNKVGWLTRQAYGYRDQEYLILKIYDLPTLRISKDL